MNKLQSFLENCAKASAANLLDPALSKAHQQYQQGVIDTIRLLINPRMASAAEHMLTTPFTTDELACLGWRKPNDFESHYIWTFWQGLGPEPEGNRDVHTEHCCAEHGCKYDSKKCTVAGKSPSKRQSHLCEDCSLNFEEFEDYDASETE